MLPSFSKNIHKFPGKILGSFQLHYSMQTFKKGNKEENERVKAGIWSIHELHPCMSYILPCSLWWKKCERHPFYQLVQFFQSGGHNLPLWAGNCSLLLLQHPEYPILLQPHQLQSVDTVIPNQTTTEVTTLSPLHLRILHIKVRQKQSNN